MSVGLSRSLFNADPQVEEIGIALTLVVKVIGAVCVQEHAIGIILSLCQKKRYFANLRASVLESATSSTHTMGKTGPLKLQTGLCSNVGRRRRTIKSTGGL